MGEGKMRGERKEQDLRSAEEREARERERRTREGKKKKERKKESGREECSQWRNFHMERLQVQLFQKTREETPIFFFSSSSTLSVRVVNALTLCARTIVRFVRVSCLFSCLAFVCCAARVQVYLGEGGNNGGRR